MESTMMPNEQFCKSEILFAWPGKWWQPDGQGVWRSERHTDDREVIFMCLHAFAGHTKSVEAVSMTFFFSTNHILTLTVTPLYPLQQAYIKFVCNIHIKSKEFHVLHTYTFLLQ